MNKKGYTFIELVIVVTIIGILSTTAILYTSNSKEKAENKNLEGLTEVVTTAMDVYHFRFGLYPSTTTEN